MLQIDQNTMMNVAKLAKSMRTLGIIGLILPFGRFFFNNTMPLYFLMQFYDEELATSLRCCIMRYRIEYISDFFLFAILAVFCGFFISHLLRLASHPIPHANLLKFSAILLIIVLISDGLLSIFHGAYIEIVNNLFLRYSFLCNDDYFRSRLVVIEVITLGLYCVPSLCTAIGYYLFKNIDETFSQMAPNYTQFFRIPYIVVIIGAVLAFISDVINIPGYFLESLILTTTLVSLGAYLLLNIGLIIVGARIINLIPLFQGGTPSPFSIPQPPTQPLPPPSPPSPPIPPSSENSPTVHLFCPNCGRIVSATSTHCIYCGQSLPKFQ